MNSHNRFSAAAGLLQTSEDKKQLAMKNKLLKGDKV